MNFEQPSGGGNDLFYPANHSCDPNVAFDLSAEDTSQWHVRALKPIKAGDPCESRDTLTLSVLTSVETVTVTFFYPSTQWTMAQPFDCLCGSMVRPVSPFAYLDSRDRVSDRSAWGELKVPSALRQENSPVTDSSTLGFGPSSKRNGADESRP